MLRSLPLCPSPVSGESFSSYVDRIAAALGVPLSVVLRGTGLMSKNGQNIRAGYGVVISAADLKRFSLAVRLPENEVAGMLLARYHDVACDMSRISPEDPISFQLVKPRMWEYWSTSHACTSCVAQSGGAWQLRWKFPWSFACTHHESLLVDTCPKCHKTIGHDSVGMRPVRRSLVPTPGACRNQVLLDPDNRRKRISWETCGYPLEMVEAHSLRTWPKLLETQSRINAALEGGEVSIAGKEVSSITYFSDLKLICSLILSWVAAEDVEHLPPAVLAEISERVHKRDELRAFGFAVHIRGGGRRAKNEAYLDYQDHFYYQDHFSSSNVASMAAALPLAVDILDADSVSTLSEALEFLVSRCYASRKKPTAWVSSCSDGLRAAFVRSWKSNELSPVRLGSKHDAQKRKDPKLAGLIPDLVPQLLWKEDCDRLFVKPLPKSRQHTNRRFCSMALVRLSGDYSWAEAAAELKLPSYKIGQKVSLFMHFLNKAGQSDEFGKRLHQLARRIALEPKAVDYGLRRRLFSDFGLIPSEEWKRICQRCGVHIGTGVRRRYASACVWSYLTGGDYLLSPAWNDLGRASRIRRNDRFFETVFKALREELLDFSSTLAERELARFAGIRTGDTKGSTTNRRR